MLTMVDSSSTMLTIFGGRVDDLTVMLREERFPDKWESRILNRYGLTGMQFNGTVLPVERAVDEKKYLKAYETTGTVKPELK
jgi:hypothetical protein